MGAAKGGFAAALAATPVRSQGPRCQLCTYIDTLDATDRADVLAAIDDATIQASVVTRALKSYGAQISNDAVRRHRNDQCSTAHELR